MKQTSDTWHFWAVPVPAPKGQKIRLDFRDEFNIEYSDDCKYDFLELRDGPFGYSPLLGRYCGKQHPPMVHSLSRYLWIRFKSDDSIEYGGFRVVYEFYQPHGQGGWIRLVVFVHNYWHVDFITLLMYKSYDSVSLACTLACPTITRRVYNYIILCHFSTASVTRMWSYLLHFFYLQTMAGSMDFRRVSCIQAYQ